MVLKAINKKLGDLKVFREFKTFGILYFSLLLLHILLKLTDIDMFITSLISKPWFLLSLLFFFYNNSEKKNSKSYYLMVFGLVAFWLGDISLIFLKNKIFFNLGILFFIIGKLLYCFRFANKRDFKFSRIIPYVLLCFGYMVFLMNFLYISLGAYFLPVLIYFFITMTVGLFAFLRQFEVNRTSYVLVFVGVMLSFISDSVAIIQAFYNQILISRLSMVVMAFYGVSQFLIVVGVLKEKKLPESDIF